MSESDDPRIEALEIDLEVAHFGDILSRHGVAPTTGLVTDLWSYAETLRAGDRPDERN